MLILKIIKEIGFDYFFSLKNLNKIMRSKILKRKYTEKNVTTIGNRYCLKVISKPNIKEI